jgi:IS4 transposase
VRQDYRARQITEKSAHYRASPFGKDIVEKELTMMFESKWLRAKAIETGLVERERKIDPVIMFWTLAIGYGSQLYRTLTELKREYEVRGNVLISDSSWHDRFTPELVKFLKECVIHGIEHMSQEPSRTLGKRLAIFRDVMIQDSTIIRLHESLASKWPATRSRRAAAGLKVAFLTSAVANSPKSLSILPENTSDLKTLRIGPWVKDIILLFDLGFYKYQLFSRIVENGGFFVSRLKSNANPVIVGINQVCNCHGIDLNSKYLKDIKLEKCDDIFDVNVEVSFDRRSYRGKSKKDNMKFRLVAVYNAEAEEHHFYMTNISPDVLSASEIAAIYAARWEIELIFKELKSRYALDKITTKSPYAIEALIWISILTLLVSRKVYSVVRKLNSDAKMVRFTQLRWSAIFVENSSRLLSAILDYLGIEHDFSTVLNVYSSEALDPHINRERFREGLWS